MTAIYYDCEFSTTSPAIDEESGEHNALADARHNQTIRRWLAEQETRTP